MQALTKISCKFPNWHYWLMIFWQQYRYTCALWSAKFVFRLNLDKLWWFPSESDSKYLIFHTTVCKGYWGTYWLVISVQLTWQISNICSKRDIQRQRCVGPLSLGYCQLPVEWSGRFLLRSAPCIDCTRKMGSLDVQQFCVGFYYTWNMLRMRYWNMRIMSGSRYFRSGFFSFAYFSGTT